MKVIIAGSRDINNIKILERAIKESGFNITEIVSGCAKGVDSLGEIYGDKNNIIVIPFPADWKDLSHADAVIKKNKYGEYDAKAGSRRNQEMADYADGAIIIIKNKSSGSMDMARRMKRMGKVVFLKHITLTRKN